jgi:hypothetical protein
MTVMQRYFKDQLHEEDNAVLGLGGFLAGLTFEKSNQPDEALRYYEEASRFAGFGSMRGAVARLMQQSPYTSPRLKELAAAGAGDVLGENEGEIVFVVGYGRVPHKIPERVPIGLALTIVSNDIHPADATAANKLAAQGLVTWINYPTLAPDQGSYTVPSVVIDNRRVQLEQAVNVSQQVRAEWKKIEGKVILSAITRLVARLAVGEGVQAASGKDSVVGFLASLTIQATLSALDTPDTRSWETLPARIAIARVRVPAGQHQVVLDARGVSRRVSLDVPKGGWALASLMALR